MGNLKRAAGLSALIALALVRCDCNRPCQVDGDCPSDQICARGMCSQGNRLTTDAATSDAGSADAPTADRGDDDRALGDLARNDSTVGDAVASDRTSSDHPALDSGTSVIDGGTAIDATVPADGAPGDTRLADARQIDRQQPDSASIDRAGPGADAGCHYNGQTCDSGFLGPLEPLCLDGECVGYALFSGTDCGASCTWPPASTACYFSRSSATTVACSDNCGCGPTVFDPAPQQVICDNHSVCHYVAASTSVSMTCNSQARCYLDCGIDAVCTVDCATDALCRMFCTGSSACTPGTCAGGWQNCGTGTWVCHRDCPPG